MAELSSLPLRYRARLALYHWHTVQPLPWSPIASLARARVAIVTSAGYYLRESQAPFLRIAGGDPSFRVIPDDTEAGSLVLGQTSGAFDRHPVESDPEVAFPRAALHALAGRGEIGSVAKRHLSFNGSITSPSRLVRETAPAAAETLLEQDVTAAVLVPI